MQKCKSFLKESITFIRYTDRTQSTAINPIAYLPQPYSNNPIQPPQEKTPENLPDITIVIPNTLKGEKSQSIDNNSSNISEQESETDVESMHIAHSYFLNIIITLTILTMNINLITPYKIKRLEKKSIMHIKTNSIYFSSTYHSLVLMVTYLTHINE